MKRCFLMILLLIPMCLLGGEEPIVALRRDLPLAIQTAKTCKVLGEPFPAVGINLTGNPVFSGFSTPSMEALKDMVAPVVLAAYSDNEELISSLTRQTELGDYESARDLFVLAESVFPPKRRAQMFKRLVPIITERLFSDTSGDQMHSAPAALLYLVYRHADRALKDENSKRFETMLDIAARKNDAAFRALLDVLIQKREIEALNRIIAETRASGMSERNLLLDRYSVKNGTLSGVDWKISSSEEVASRFYSCLRKRSAYAVLLAQAMSLDEGRIEEHRAFVDGLLMQHVREIFLVAAKDCPSESRERAYYSYLTLRHDFSIEAFGFLLEYFYRIQDFENVAIVIKYVRGQQGGNAEVDSWCDFKEVQLKSAAVSCERADAAVKELLECGVYENSEFEKRFQSSLRGNARRN